MAKIGIRYFGFSAFEVITEKGTKVLIDPCITGFKSNKFSPVGLDDVADVDLILVTHAAFDHLGDTLELGKRTRCHIMCGQEVAYYLMKKGIAEGKVQSVLYGHVHGFKGLQVRCVDARHISLMRFDDEIVTGVPFGYILYTESGLGIYHAGDTSIFSDMKLFGELYQPKIGMLPIGGVMPTEYTGDMSPDESALVTKWMGLEVVIPMHHHPDSDKPSLFAELVRKEAPKAKAVVLKPGESFWHNF